MDYKRAYGYEKSIYEYYVIGVVAFHGDDVVNGSCYGRLTGSQENVYLYTLFEKKGTMKTAIKLVLVYFVMQILAALLAMPFAMLYSYAVSGTIDGANTIALAPSMLLGFVGMGMNVTSRGRAAKASSYRPRTISIGAVLAVIAFLMFQFFPRQIISIFGDGSELYYHC